MLGLRGRLCGGGGVEVGLCGRILMELKGRMVFFDFCVELCVLRGWGWKVR